MKRIPFLEDSFVLRLSGSRRIISVINTDGECGSAPIHEIRAERVVVMTSLAAHRIARFLTADSQGRERLAYGTGYRFANTLTVDRFVPVQTTNSSKVHVDPDPASRLKALGELDRFGLSLQALFHSHPGRTEHSVNPSATDLETQQNLEAKYGSIGAICNSGGFLQFFSVSKSFHLVMVGKGIEDHGFRQEKRGFFHLVRLCYLHADPVQGPKPRLMGRIANRAARALSLVQERGTGREIDRLVRTGHWIPRG